jgi:hypothetical protein
MDWFKLVTSSMPWGAKPRHPRWRSTSNAWLAKQPECAACGSKKSCVVHHKVPVSVDASLELSESNFITMCDDCHLFLAHLGAWTRFNPHIDIDANTYKLRLQQWSEYNLRKQEITP